MLLGPLYLYTFRGSIRLIILADSIPESSAILLSDKVYQDSSVCQLL